MHALPHSGRSVFLMCCVCVCLYVFRAPCSDSNVMLSSAEGVGLCICVCVCVSRLGSYDCKHTHTHTHSALLAPGKWKAPHNVTLVTEEHFEYRLQISPLLLPCNSSFWLAQSLHDPKCLFFSFFMLPSTSQVQFESTIVHICLYKTPKETNKRKKSGQRF